MDSVKGPWRTLGMGLLLGGVTIAVFWPVAHNDFIVFDDRAYVVANPNVQGGLSWETVTWAFTSFESSNWHPLTWLSHALDCQLFGLNPAGHHLTSLGFHVANVLLLFVFLKRATGALWRSALVAALFAWHPLRVESVAWVAERKDVLSGFFFLLTLGAYARYGQEPGLRGEGRGSGVEGQGQGPERATRLTAAGRNARWWYGLALLFFACGLMSKPMLVTVPFVLLLLDYWPLGRFELKTENLRLKVLLPFLWEKTPFFALAAASSVVTFVAQQEGGSVESLERLPFGARLSNALVAGLGYLQKLVWPSRLAVVYLRPDVWPAWQIGLGLAVLIGVTALVLGRGRRYPWLMVGWFGYLVMLVPVIGLVQVGPQYMADRYTYLPAIGLFIMLSWSAAELACRHAVPRVVLLAAALLGLTAVGLAARRQVGFWQNSVTLFRHCLEVTHSNYIAHNNLGTALMLRGDFEEAKAQLLQAVRLRPRYSIGLNNLGLLLAQHGDVKEAARYLQQAEGGGSALEDIYVKLGLDLDGRGQTDRAVICYRECLRLNPNRLEAQNNLAWILATSADPKLRDGHEAVRLAERACESRGYQQSLLVGTLAAAYAEAGRFPEAVATAEKAIALAAACGQQDLAARNAQLVELYRARKAFRENQPVPAAK